MGAIAAVGVGASRKQLKLVELFPHAEGHMGDQSIAVIKSKNTSDTYYVVDNYYNDKEPKKSGYAEELLDQTSDCK